MLSRLFCKIILVVIMTVCLSATGCDKVSMNVGKPPAWEVVIDLDGQPIKFPLEVMNVYLVEEEERYPETFEIIGEGISLVGQFPLDLHVGYEEDWRKLFNQEIDIKVQLPKSYSYDLKTIYSKIKIEGESEQYIKNGSFTFRKLTGKYSGQNGDLTLSGDITFNVVIQGVTKTLRGTIAVHGVSWG